MMNWSQKKVLLSLITELKSQKGVEVIFSKIKNSNHFFKNKENELILKLKNILKEKTALI